MSSFLRSMFGGSNSADASKLECTVCLTPVIQGDSFTDPSGCGHLLHLQCFLQAQASFHSTCPTCRAPFKVSGGPSAAIGAPAIGTPALAPITMQEQQYITRILNGTPPSERDVMVPPEEPLITRRVAPVAAAAASAAPSTATVPTEPTVELLMTPEVPAVEASSERRLFVNISTISKETEVSDLSRVGVDLVMILDKSGSMGGEKERLLRNAVEFVIDELDERDRLSTVAFDNHAHFEHGLINMGPTGRAKALTHARGGGLRASGGTDIYDGLKTGVAALNARKIPNAVTTIFLLTDGIDNSHLEEKLALARHARSMGWFMFIFAFGSDHNATHLNAIAEAADSSYIFIDNLATVREAFGGAIGSQQGVAGKLLNLTINAADEGIIIHRAISGQYATNVAADGRMAVVTYPNLLIGESRDCCVEISLPAVGLRGSAENTILLTASLTYTPATAAECGSTSEDVSVTCPACIVARPESIDTPAPRNAVVDSQINRLTGIDVIERATRLADANNLDEARAVVTKAKSDMASSISATHPVTQSMIAELAECMGRLQTKREWETVGRSEQIESYNIHNCQRGVYAKKSRYTPDIDSGAVAYASSKSKACQSKSKSSF